MSNINFSDSHLSRCRCGTCNSRNRSLVESQSGVYQCSGCTQMYTAEQVAYACVGDRASGGVYIPREPTAVVTYP
jgi:hypothetical protein